jgi:RNA polymerase sigma-70 factor (ECF subfamily)
LSESHIQSQLALATRQHWGRLYAILVARFNDFELAEESLQEAFVSALTHWPKAGIPDNIAAWLLTAAKNKALDLIRRQQVFADKAKILEIELAHSEGHTEPQMERSIPDQRLKLIFTCCHPALSEDVQVALTLHTLAGLKTSEIARVFLMPETSMAQRLVRAKRKIKLANIPFQVPEPNEYPSRLNAVLKVIYFIFNEGYTASRGEHLIKHDLCKEAIFLGSIVLHLLPENPEVLGLNALMLMHHSRTKARLTNTGGLVDLEHQDRRLWNQTYIKEGDRLIKQALAKQALGPYQLQAAISGVHAHAKSFSDTNWQEICLLYEQLYRRQPTPVVKLNAIVAQSFCKGVDFALEQLSKLEQENTLSRYQPFYAVKADLLRRMEHGDAAKACYRQAIDLSEIQAEKDYLQGKLRRIK